MGIREERLTGRVCLRIGGLGYPRSVVLADLDAVVQFVLTSTNDRGVGGER